MPALFPIILATQIVLVADSVPKFDVEPTCRSAVRGTEVPERASMDCQQDEQNARSKLEKDWSQYGAALRNECDGLVTNSGGAPSYVELLTCLEMAKQAKELPEDSKIENIGRY